MRGGKRQHIRAKIVIEAARAWLREHPLRLDVAHNHYVEEMHRIGESRRRETANTLRSLEQKKDHAQKRLQEIKKRIEELDDSSLASLYKEDVKKEKATVREADEALRPNSTAPSEKSIRTFT
ncbi:hypothetical protein A2501_02500 [Candidatus Uhrbacteria bacterium RIFOXYC12_FULL_57_11]|nr:MAG: hypothetical protein A2501_02500 [Candidatus Uhrbacteria bacterium RIFOXYC12_FULL_57_11]